VQDFIKEWLPAFIFVPLLCGIVYAPFHFIRKDEAKCEALERACGLPPGARVRSVLDGTPGMVTGRRCASVWVRFSANASRTDSRWGTDGQVTREPFAEVRMDCYEVARDNSGE
jgi:hypothetical protein